MNLDKHMSRFVPEVYFFSGYEPEICLQNYITGITKELLKHKFQSHPWQLKLSLKYEPLTVFQSPTLQTSWRLAAFLNQEVKTSRNPHNSITKNRTRTSRAWSRKTARSTAISHTPSISSQTNRTKKKTQINHEASGGAQISVRGETYAMSPALERPEEPTATTTGGICGKRKRNAIRSKSGGKQMRGRRTRGRAAPPPWGERRRRRRRRVRVFARRAGGEEAGGRMVAFIWLSPVEPRWALISRFWASLGISSLSIP